MTRKALRAALYTRKSSDEGLEQDFNSLDAQREACAAFVASQAGEGWAALPDRYDDGGFSGGSMGRPGLQRLLADIEAGRVDIVVVYKIDRLTRSLPDFARMVEVFDRHEVSFVSVTQAFNTTTSMGRLTLNVLLSFAQFEREVTGERIRDKMAASKARGMWMGGRLPLGYDPPVGSERRLVVNEGEAETVRLIFERYLALGSVRALEVELDRRGIRSKLQRYRNGRTSGGQTFSRGALFHLLKNRVYLGQIVHKGQVFAGLHDPVIGEEMFRDVQTALANRSRRAANVAESKAPLTGRIFDADGKPMSPTFSIGGNGRRYRYYVSALLHQGRATGDGNHPRRVAAEPLEALLAERLRAWSIEPPDLKTIARVEVATDRLTLSFDGSPPDDIEDRIGPKETYAEMPGANRWQIVLPWRNAMRGGAAQIVGSGTPGPRPDPVLIRALREAHAMIARDAKGLPLLTEAPTSPHRRKLVRLAFLAPDLQRAIMSGRHPKGLTLARLIEGEMPLAWDDQIRTFGRPTG